MKYDGTIVKMESTGTDPVTYHLPVGDDYIPISNYIGKYISLEFRGDIFCIGCGRKTSKSFAQGYCYPCMLSELETSKNCVMF
ncbi:MAG: DUF2797 domain-containing protein [Candidatus Marinimicrobia bacterium]|nr:DUF2797 domain-containing protein [Candidatus Neomarinimicrobiota bacterium]